MIRKPKDIHGNIIEVGDKIVYAVPNLSNGAHLEEGTIKKIEYKPHPGPTNQKFIVPHIYLDTVNKKRRGIYSDIGDRFLIIEKVRKEEKDVEEMVPPPGS